MAAGMVYYCCKRRNAMVRGNQEGQAGPMEFNNLNYGNVPVIGAADAVVQNPQGMVHIKFRIILGILPEEFVN